MEIFNFPTLEIYHSDFGKIVGAGKSTLMSKSGGLVPSVFRRKMEKTRLMGGKMDGQVFISRSRWHFCFDVLLYKSTFPYLYLDLAGKQF